MMEKWGNERGNRLYEANLTPQWKKNREDIGVSDMKRFIREKYELKRFIANEQPPENSRAAPSDNRAPQAGRRENSAQFGNGGQGGASRPQVKVNASPAKQAAPAPAAKPAPSLLDFMDDPAPPAAAPPPVPSFSPDGDIFGNFSSTPAPAAPNDPFGSSDPFASSPAPASSGFGADPFAPSPSSAPSSQPQQAQAVPDMFGGFDAAPAPASQQQTLQLISNLPKELSSVSTSEFTQYIESG